MFRSFNTQFRLQMLASVAKRRTRVRRSNAVCEALECRLMFDAYSVIEGTHLAIEGTSYNDEVVVYYDQDGVLTVKSSSDEQRGYAFVHHPGAASVIDKIVFSGGWGNDQFINMTTLNLIAIGGDGNDILNAGNSRYAALFGGRDNDILIGNEWRNWLFGEEEHDTLMGLGGDDRLYGGSGEDKLLGYEGTDLLFGGSGVDKLYGGEGVDYLDGGYDYGTDFLSGESDGIRDVVIDEPTGATFVSDLESIDDVYEIGWDTEYEFRTTGKLPVSLGVNSSGYGIGEGTSFEFTAQDFDFSAIEIDWQNHISDVDAYFANWMSNSLDEISEPDNAFAPEEPEAMVETDPDLLVGIVNVNWDTETAVDGYYIEEVPVDYELITDIDEVLLIDDSTSDFGEIVEAAGEALDADVSVVELDIDEYAEAPAIPPVEPVTTWSSFVTLQPSFQPSVNRFRRFG